MSEEQEIILRSLAAIVVLGLGAQWIAWRLKLPSILFLLAAGFAAGQAGLGFIDPEKLFGNVLFPIVSLSVAVILFEGGLTLRVSELRETGKVVLSLILLGALVTWGLTTAAACWILGFDFRLAVLFGALLIVTGPTVVLPLLRQVRPGVQIRNILKWEGILNDPLGAIVAVLVFQAFFLKESGEPGLLPAVGGLLQAALIGGGLGIVGAGGLLFCLKRYLIPDFLQSAITLMTVVVVFALSNKLAPESGILGVTVMGLCLPNQRWVAVRHIIEFKENLRVLLISALFIVLSARITLAELQELGWREVLFAGSLIFLVRPASVFISSIGSGLSLREKLFLSWMAPRGIVAAAVASVFALSLSGEVEGAEKLVPVTFLLICSTIFIYGLTARPLAIRLGVALANPQGVLFIGAHSWARQIAAVLRDQGVGVLLADSNRANINKAKMEGFDTFLGNVLSEDSAEEMDLGAINRLVALTPNDDANCLAALHFREVFERRELYQLSDTVAAEPAAGANTHLRCRELGTGGLTYPALEQLFLDGGVVKAVNLGDEFSFEALQARYGESCTPLFLIDSKGGLEVFTSDSGLHPVAGDKIILIAGEGSAGSDGKQQSA
ncbi:MAG: cation:proton antiporter [Planctomycetota bacterium]